jgi:hypothetical protein
VNCPNSMKELLSIHGLIGGNFEFRVRYFGIAVIS